MPFAAIPLFFLVTFLAAGGAVVWYTRTASQRTPPDAPGAEDQFDWLTPVRAPTILKEESLSSISLWDQLLGRVDGIERMQTIISQAGVNWSVGRLTLMMLLAGAATLAILWRIKDGPNWVILFAALLAGTGPYLAILRRRQKRLQQFEVQFPEALDSLARSLRAGNALAGALDLLARETPQPLASELRHAVEERKLGISWDVALDHFARRVPVVEVSVFVAAVQLQSRTGGKLHEVLGKLAETMREQSALKGEIRSISAHGRLTGNILTALPLVITVMMSFVNPDSLWVLWRDPVGRNLIWIAGGCLILAHFVLRKMADIRL
jgi:tight adherence protein B